MPKRVNFTKANLDALPVPKVGRAQYYDTKVPSLAVRVTAAGTKTFCVYKWVDGRPQRLLVGKYPAVTPEAARRQAAQLLGQIAGGQNPQEQRRRARVEVANTKTLQEVWAHYLANHLQRYCSPATVKGDAYFFAPLPWKTHKLTSITTDQIKHLHRELGAGRGPYMANRVLGLLRVLYNYAADELGYKEANPVKIHKRARGDRRRGSGITLFPEKARDRFLQPDEVPAFFKALADEPDTDFRDLVLLLLYTGARRGNVQAMRWSEVHLERALWVIPADKSKNRDEVKIPLSRWALAILTDRATRRLGDGQVDWVFPARRSKAGHWLEPKKLWWALRERAALPDLTMHDLRRTLATYQRTTGATLEMIGASLGHRSRVSTETYARVDLTPVRTAVEAATVKLLEAANGSGKGLPGPDSGHDVVAEQPGGQGADHGTT